MGKPKPNKYGAKRKTYNGVSYHSTLEADYAAKLDLRIKAGEVTRWKRQPEVELKIEGRLWRKWAIDFKVFFPDGHCEWHECKGVETIDYKMKRDAFHILYPGEILRIIKKI